MVTLSVIVYYRNRSTDDILLSTIGILGGLAVVIAEVLPRS